MKERGYIHVYTGNGKGKTSSCIGLTIRSLGAGYKVFFSQFMKNGEYSEIKALRLIGEKVFSGQLELHQYGLKGKLFQKPDEKDRIAAEEGLQKVTEASISGSYDLVVLDEVNIALQQGLLKENDILDLMQNKHINTELVLSGRYASDKIIEKADLVSKIDSLKHYAQTGVRARLGIEK